MIGSHNSLSYLHTKSIFKSWAKCQEVNYIKQYNLGVRCFDIRIKFKKDIPVIVHNNVTYEGGEELLNQFFKFINNKEDCYLRLILDIRSKPKDHEKQIELFKEYIEYIKSNFPKIKWNCAYISWNQIYFVDNDYPLMMENHASVMNEVCVFKKPIHYAKKNNKRLSDSFKEVIEASDKVLLVDFVELL